MQRRDRIRRHIRAGRINLRWMDYRYRQCRRCGWNADDPTVWTWWTSLHWTARATLVRLSLEIIKGTPPRLQYYPHFNHQEW